MKSTFLKYLALAAFAGVVTERASAATTVGLELGLLVDVSGSVDASEFALQRDGYVAAFNSPAIQAAITTLAAQNGGHGLAVSYMMWSGPGQQQLSVGWTEINDAAGASAFAASIAAAARPFSGNTALGDGIKFGTDSMNSNLFDSARQVLDVSGDGENNDGSLSGAQGRDYAAANGIDKINGLPIGLGSGALPTYYVDNVQYGAGSFTLPANNFAAFNSAVERKILAEITNTNPVPEGGPGLVLSGILFAGLAGLRMKMRAKAA